MNFPAQFLSNFLWNSDSEPNPILIDIFNDVQVAEPLTDPAQFVDALARIFDDDPYLILLVWSFYNNAHLSIEGILHSISDDVNKYLANSIFVLKNSEWNTFVDLHRKEQIFLDRHRLKYVSQFFEQIPKVEVSIVQFKAIYLNLWEILHSKPNILNI